MKYYINYHKFRTINSEYPANVGHAIKIPENLKANGKEIFKINIIHH